MNIVLYIENYIANIVFRYCIISFHICTFVSCAFNDAFFTFFVAFFVISFHLTAQKSA